MVDKRFELELNRKTKLRIHADYNPKWHQWFGDVFLIISGNEAKLGARDSEEIINNLLHALLNEPKRMIRLHKYSKRLCFNIAVLSGYTSLVATYHKEWLQIFINTIFMRQNSPAEESVRIYIFNCKGKVQKCIRVSSGVRKELIKTLEKMVEEMKVLRESSQQ